VAEALSFTAAGARIGLTPSAISQLVGELEAAVGFRLFDRSTRRVSLTAAGKEFLPSAESVLRHANLAERAAVDVRDRSAGLVRVAAPMVIAGLMLPKAIAEWRRERPDVVVRILDTAVERLADAVGEGEADLAVGPDRPTPEDLATQVLFESPWVLWCAPSHPLARRRTVRWAELRGHALVAAGRDHERSLAPLLGAGKDPARVAPLELVDNISTALGIAATGVAATLSPAYVRRWATKLGLVARPLGDPVAMRAVSLYRPAQRRISTAAEGFALHLANWLSRTEGRK
jgi:DNA-binding transcriptional LysR family regulator